MGGITVINIYFHSHVQEKEITFIGKRSKIAIANSNMKFIV